jgi:AraC-like DNA-binding protein
MKKTFDSRRTDFTPYGFSCELWAPQRMPRADRHNEIELNLLTAGSLTYLMNGRTIQVETQRLTVFWAAIPHQIIDYRDTAPYYVATIPLAWFLRWKLPEAFVQPILAGHITAETQEDRAAGDLLLFQQWTQDMQAHAPENAQTAQLEMEARFRRLSRSHATREGRSGSSPYAHSSEEPAKIEQIAAYIAQHYSEPLHLEDIGAAVGLHPNYAANLFRKAFGTTINSHIIECRISHAQRMLLTTDHKVLSIALAAGFNSLSRFNVAFRKCCGCTPREYRLRHIRA